MKVRVDDPERLPDLISALSARVDAIVSRLSDDEVEVSLLGSRNAAADLAELEERIRHWGGSATVIRPEPRRGWRDQ
jgi:hypothetical protein